MPSEFDCRLVVDARFDAPAHLQENIKIERVKPHILTRLMAEWRLARRATKLDTVLSFGNLPPLFNLRAKTAVFVQNRYLVDNQSLSEFGLKTKIRLGVEQFWLRHRTKNVDLFCVQTQTMASLLSADGLSGSAPVKVLPFAAIAPNNATASPAKSSENKPTSFIYVASGEPHKNHRQLIEAWCQLATEGIFPTLRLTLNSAQWPELCVWIEARKQQYNLDIENLGLMSHVQLYEWYGQTEALIYPSKFESFGLPLIEARQENLSILAAELDYVRDLVEPDQTFDPTSPISIARAVKRFLNVPADTKSILSAERFIQEIQRELK